MATGITNVLTQEFLLWISRNRITFMIVVLIGGNVYQYMDRGAGELQCALEKKALNDEIHKIQAEATEYERRRSDKLEFLIQALPKPSSPSTSSNGINNANSNAKTGSN